MEKRNTNRYGKCLSNNHLDAITSRSIDNLAKQIDWQRKKANLCPICGTPLEVTFDVSRIDVALTVFKCQCDYKKIEKTYK